MMIGQLGWDKTDQIRALEHLAAMLIKEVIINMRTLHDCYVHCSSIDNRSQDIGVIWQANLIQVVTKLTLAGLD